MSVEVHTEEDGKITVTIPKSDKGWIYYGTIRSEDSKDGMGVKSSGNKIQFAASERRVHAIFGAKDVHTGNKIEYPEVVIPASKKKKIAD